MKIEATRTSKFGLEVTFGFGVGLVFDLFWCCLVLGSLCVSCFFPGYVFGEVLLVVCRVFVLGWFCLGVCLVLCWFRFRFVFWRYLVLWFGIVMY